MSFKRLVESKILSKSVRSLAEDKDSESSLKGAPMDSNSADTQPDSRRASKASIQTNSEVG